MCIPGGGKPTGEKEETTMTNTTYTFKKDGKTYSVKGNNLWDAQTTVELLNGIDLTGATYEVVYKLRVIRTGIVK